MTIQSEAKQVPTYGYRLALAEATDRADSTAWHEQDIRVVPLPAVLGSIFEPTDASDSSAYHRNPWDVVEELEQAHAFPTHETKRVVRRASRLNDCLRDFVSTKVAGENQADLYDAIVTDADLAAKAVQLQLNEYSKLQLSLSRQGW